MASQSPPAATLPAIHLLCMEPEARLAFETAIFTHFPLMQNHASSPHFNAIVSPANSYARLDGAFDDALSRAYSPPGDYDWLTRKAQAVLYREYRGFAPPGTCTVVRLDHDRPGDAKRRNPWETEYLLLCPAMRIPSDVRWDREVVYECVWSMLCAVDKHNRAVREGRGGVDTEISSLLMTPLATGCGNVSFRRWAEQFALAMKHWVEAVEEPQVWAQVGWKEVFEKRDDELKGTWGGKESELPDLSTR